MTSNSTLLFPPPPSTWELGGTLLSLPSPPTSTCTGSFSCFCLSLGSRTPLGLFTLGSSYPGVFPSCIVLKHFSQMARFPLFTDFFSNCDVSRILYIVLGAHKLRARRTVCKSVFFFSKDINCWRKIRGLFWLKEPWSRRFGNLPTGQKSVKNDSEYMLRGSGSVG